MKEYLRRLRLVLDSKLKKKNKIKQLAHCQCQYYNVFEIITRHQKNCKNRIGKHSKCQSPMHSITQRQT
jgi:hypothetical protein